MSYTITPACTGCTACVRKCPVDAISGERKQLHRVDPALCIDCGACGRICPVDAVLDEAGELARPVEVSRWLQPVWNYRACVKCRICVAACPAGSISLARSMPRPRTLDGAYPYLHAPKTCIGCSFCAACCPTDAIVMKEPLGRVAAENLDRKLG
jgi:Na+-translocating ferredoxin:NAD+ oxidoreductase subunit B